MHIRCLRRGIASPCPSSWSLLAGGLPPFTRGFPPPDFLAPSLYQKPSRTRPFQRVRRGHATFSHEKHTVSDALHGPSAVAQSVVRSSPREASHKAESPRPSNPFDVLKPYLPVELRTRSLKTPVNYRPAPSTNREPARPLVEVLRDSTSSLPQPALSHIALQDGRWRAFPWLVKKLASSKIVEALVPPDESLEAAELWQNYGSLSTMTTLHITLDAPPKPLESTPRTLDELLPGRRENIRPQGHDESARRNGQDSMEMVWESLGFVVLGIIENCTGMLAQHRMAYVYEAIAHLHSMGAVSPLLYGFDDNDVPVAIRKPPLLSLLQSRIMVTLTDAAWSATASSTMIQSSSGKGSSSPHALGSSEDSYTPAIDPLRPELWLELILWSCVHDGYFKVAARLLMRMANTRGLPWTSIPWRELERSFVDRHPKLSSWLLRLSGTAEGYENQPHLEQGRPRTVSSEVVLAIWDGFSHEFRKYGTSLVSTPRLLAFSRLCQRFACVGHTLDDLLFWNGVLMKITDAAQDDLRADSSILTCAFELAQLCHRIVASLDATDSEQLWVIEMASEHSSPLASGLSWSMHGCFINGQIDGAMRLCSQFKEFVAASRTGTESSQTQASAPQQLAKSGTEEPGLSLSDLSPGPSAPPALIARLLSEVSTGVLDLQTHNVDDLVLLAGGYGEDSPIWSNVSFWPSLLQLATATRNDELMGRVYDKVGNLTKPSADILVALLHCQVSLGEWDRARSLFAVLARIHHHRPTAAEICLVARKLLLSEKGDEADMKLVEEGGKLLSDLLTGAYCPARPHLGRQADPLLRVRQQLCRLLATSLGTCQKNAGVLVRQYRLDQERKVMLPTRAFNTLLDGVATAYGSGSAAWLYRQWCYNSPVGLPKEDQIRSKAQRAALEQDKLVLPNLQTVRTMLAPAEADLRVFLESQQNRGDQSVSSSGPLKAVEDHLPWRAFASGEEVDLADFRLPDEAPKRRTIEWGWCVYQHLLQTAFWLSEARLMHQETEQEPDDDDGLSVAKGLGTTSVDVAGPPREGLRPIFMYADF